jgi:ATP-binding cassette subfamily G (WHITE) protein 2 (SNQ2)
MFNPLIKIKEGRRAKAAAKASTMSEKEKTSQTGSGTLGKNEKFLIQGLSGVLKSGEMALVVGRPGSGCTTFLKVRPDSDLKPPCSQSLKSSCFIFLN